MLPVLRESAKDEIKISDCVESLATQLSLTADERSDLLPSGKQTTFANRVHWAKSYLGKAGLIALTKRAHFKITDLGREVLRSPPTRIDIKFLEKFPDFEGFRNSASTSTPDQPAAVVGTTVMTPDEIIRKSQAELENQLGTELLGRIIASAPEFFERLVVQLLVAMGYGGSSSNAARALGRSGDGGVDGVIDQDALGLDRIYVQAKRYAVGNAVGSAAIRDFFGSLDRFKAAKGLFVTTSTFSSSAKETAEFLSKRLVLIDGRQLAQLMIRFNVGCRVEETIVLKRLDEELCSANPIWNGPQAK